MTRCLPAQAPDSGFKMMARSGNASRRRAGAAHPFSPRPENGVCEGDRLLFLCKTRRRVLVGSRCIRRPAKQIPNGKIRRVILAMVLRQKRVMDPVKLRIVQNEPRNGQAPAHVQMIDRGPNCCAGIMSPAKGRLSGRKGALRRGAFVRHWAARSLHQSGSGALGFDRSGTISIRRG
jgi:hypothetical protein